MENLLFATLEQRFCAIFLGNMRVLKPSGTVSFLGFSLYWWTFPCGWSCGSDWSKNKLQVKFFLLSYKYYSWTCRLQESIPKWSTTNKLDYFKHNNYCQIKGPKNCNKKMGLYLTFYVRLIHATCFPSPSINLKIIVQF